MFECMNSHSMDSGSCLFPYFYIYADCCQQRHINPVTIPYNNLLSYLMVQCAVIIELYGSCVYGGLQGVRFSRAEKAVYLVACILILNL